jgi:hypothetical protein
MWPSLAALWVATLGGSVLMLPACSRTLMVPADDRGGPTAAPTPSSGTAKVVYNVLASPAITNRPLQLKDKTATKIDFYIGSPAAATALPPDTAKVPDPIRDAETLELTVAMSCLVCDSDRLQSRHIVYTRRSGESTHATFEIVPSAEAAEAARKSALTFSVSANGLEYSHIVLPVSILRATGRPLAEVTAGVVTEQFAEIRAGAQADLRLLIGADNSSGTLAVEIEPILPELRNRLASILNGKPSRKFRSGLSRRGVAEVVDLIYGALRGVVNQKEQALQQALVSIGAAVPPPTTEVSLTPSEGAALAAELLPVGQHFYTRLFIQGAEPGLARSIDAIAGMTSARPLRVRLETSDLELPWQFLHPPESDKTADFWGFRYALAVRPNSSLSAGRLAEVVSIGRGGRVLFARFNGDPSKDVIANLGSQQMADLVRVFGPENVKTTNSRAGLVDSIRTEGPELTALFFFTHGTSGATVIEAGSGTPVLGKDVLGERLIFGKKDAVTPLELFSLGYGSRPVRLRRGPMVFFNACESGVAVVDSGFPSAAFSLGAGAVVAAEAPIWAHFGYYFGRDFTDAVVNGTPLADALLSTRRLYLERYNNPLGLSYSYYGGLNLATDKR